MRGKAKHALAALLGVAAFSTFAAPAAGQSAEEIRARSVQATKLLLTGKYDEALAYAAETLRQAELELGSEHSITIESVHDLAGLMQETGRTVEAEQLLRRALEARERTLGAEHPDTLRSANALGSVFFRSGRLAEAEPIYRRLLETHERVLGPEHPITVVSADNLAAVLHLAGRFAEAEQLQRRAIADWRMRYRRGALVRDASWTAGGNGFRQIALTAQLGESASIEAREAALISAQLGKRVDVAGGALAAATELIARNDALIAALIRERDAAAEALDALEARQTTAFFNTGAAAAQALAPQVAAARAAIDAKAAQVSQRFPDYADLVATEFLDLEAAKALLGSNEALLTLLEVQRSNIVESAWFAVLITRGGAAVELLPGNPKDVTAQMKALRASVAPLSQGQAPNPFDLATAHALYRDLIAPLEPHLNVIKRLLVVSDGPLQSLPLEALVTAPPPEGAFGPDAYREAQWLGDRYEIAVLPSVSALRALRRTAGAATGKTPLLAFADAALKPRKPPAPAAIANSLVARFLRERGLQTVCDADRVPAGRQIVLSLQRVLNAKPEAVIVGKAASEGRVRALNASGALKDARILAFNAYGVTAAEVPGGRDYAQPALALTPKGGCGARAPSALDPAHDGFLTLSEITQLDLDADWVLLTACNTAAGDGALRAEPLSGLARGFFYAGARAILASHWPAQVARDPLGEEGPTELLMRELFAPERAGLSKAAALGEARRAVRARYPHPAHWAVFSLIGDGS